MGARHKLNQTYIKAAIIFSAVIGLIAKSWVVFLVALAASIALNIYSGDIRTKSGRRR